jgi:hypothetical protein
MIRRRLTGGQPSWNRPRHPLTRRSRGRRTRAGRPGATLPPRRAFREARERRKGPALSEWQPDRVIANVRSRKKRTNKPERCSRFLTPSGCSLRRTVASIQVATTTRERRFTP